MLTTSDTQFTILFIFPSILLFTIPLRLFKDVIYPDFDPQEWPFISSNGFLNRFLAGHCFEIFLIVFLLFNSFKYWFIKWKSPLLPIIEHQDEIIDNNINHNYEFLKSSKSDRHLLKQFDSNDIQVAKPLKYVYLQMTKLLFIYVLISILIVWFFGASIYDRIYYLTGGYCKNHPEFKFYRSCVVHGYQYVNGFKPSGHSLITSTFASSLAFEIKSLNCWLTYINSFNPLSFKVNKISSFIIAFALFIYTCWLIMFTVTCLFYHTLIERVVGTISGYLIVFLVYVKYKL